MITILNIADLKDPNDPQGRTYREVNNAKVHKFDKGDLVEITYTGVRLFVAKQTRDCDGSLLYSLTPNEDDFEQEQEGFCWVNGWGEESLVKIR